MRGYRRTGKARRRRCASFAPPERRRYSGKWRAEPRPTGRTLRRLLAEVGPGDVVTVTRLDRLARSTRDLLNTLAAVTGKKAGFRSLADAWADTTTAHGRLMLTVLGGLAEFERELIRVRTGGGRARAKANGQSLPRPQAKAYPAPAARGDPAPRPGRTTGRHRPQLQRPPGNDFTARNLTLDAKSALALSQEDNPLNVSISAGKKGARVVM